MCRFDFGWCISCRLFRNEQQINIYSCSHLPACGHWCNLAYCIIFFLCNTVQHILRELKLIWPLWCKIKLDFVLVELACKLPVMLLFMHFTFMQIRVWTLWSCKRNIFIFLKEATLQSGWQHGARESGMFQLPSYVFWGSSCLTGVLCVGCFAIVPSAMVYIFSSYQGSHNCPWRFQMEKNIK